jgi:rubrerythrin
MSDPTKPTDMGRNRTGIATSPIDGKELAEGARASTPLPQTDGQILLAERVSWSRDVAPVGTMPPPASVKGVAKAAMDAIRGKSPLAFLDLIGERLAFERTGTRLYEALLAKLEAAHEHAGGPTREDLERIRDEELAHFAMLKEAVESLGADPTAITPSADIAGVASMGLLQSLTDPRTTLSEGLKAILIAELADNDGWLVLADVADRLGHDQLAERFRRALADEEEHLARVRAWVAASVDAQAGLESRGAQPAGSAGVNANLGNSAERRE